MKKDIPYDPEIFQRKPHISPEEHAQDYTEPLMCRRGSQKHAKCSQKMKQAVKQDVCTATWAEVQTNRVTEDTRTKAILISQRHACF